MPDIFDTYVLNRVVEETTDDTQFLVDTFFPAVNVSEEETILFDRVNDDRQFLAPFVSPLIEGRVVTEDGFETDSFTPAYVKDKRVFNPNRVPARMPGEKIGGSVTKAQRLASSVNWHLSDQMAMLNRRYEWMAAKIIVDSQVTISGEKYPTKLIDFKRKSTLRKVLTSTARWGESGVSPLTDLETWAQLVMDETGRAPTFVIMTSDSLALLKADTRWEKLVDTQIKNNGGNTIEGTNTVKPRAGVKYVGRFNELDLWVYTGKYKADNGAMTPYLPAYTVLVGSRDVEGVRHFGAIKDLKAGLQPRQYFVKSWEVEDPSERYILMQTAPLLVPYRINNVLSATVR